MMPLIRWRVVCTFGDTMASFSPIKALRRVLFPAFGRPNMFTNPDFIMSLQRYGLKGSCQLKTTSCTRPAFWPLEADSQHTVNKLRVADAEKYGLVAFSKCPETGLWPIPKAIWPACGVAGLAVQRLCKRLTRPYWQLCETFSFAILCCCLWQPSRNAPVRFLANFFHFRQLALLNNLSNS